MSSQPASAQLEVRNLLAQQEALYGDAITVVGLIKAGCDKGHSVDAQLAELSRLSQKAAQAQAHINSLRSEKPERQHPGSQYADAVSRVEVVLRKLLGEIEGIVKVLQRSKHDLLPQLGDVARHRQMRNAYGSERDIRG